MFAFHLVHAEVCFVNVAVGACHTFLKATKAHVGLLLKTSHALQYIWGHNVTFEALLLINYSVLFIAVDFLIVFFYL